MKAPAPAAGRPRPRRPRRNRAATEAAIVAAATELVARKGPDGFGLAELGARAGVSFGLIHHYFGGKTGLLREALRQPFTRQLARVVGLYADGKLPRDAQPIVALLFGAGERNPEYVRLLAWGALTGLLTEDVFAGSRTAIARLLALYRDASGIDPPRRTHGGEAATDPRAIAALLLAATLGYQLFRPFLRSLLQVDERFDPVYRRHVEHALSAFRATRTAGTRRPRRRAHRLRRDARNQNRRRPART